MSEASSNAPLPPSPDSEPQLPASYESLDSLILRMLMDATPDRIYFKDLESRFVRNNIAQAQLLGAASPDACVGKTDFDYFSREHAALALADEKEILRTGRAIVGKLEHITLRDGSTAWVSTTKLPWRDSTGHIIGTFGMTRDVTATKVAEEKLTVERNLLRTIIDHLPARVYVKDTASRYLLNNLAHLAMLGLTRQDQATGRTILDFFPQTRGQQAMADDQQVLSSGQAILNQEKSDFGVSGEVHWALTTKVPLRDGHDQVVGLVGISHDITRRKRAEEELQRRTDVMEADVQMARQVQETFLPRSYPVFPRGVPTDSSALRFAHRYIPAATLGGDFFNIVQLSDTKCGVLVCDVMGHGVRAGLLTALIRGVIGELGERAGDPTQVLSEINRSLTPILEQTGQPVFATTFFGVIDTADDTIVYGNAGHPAPLLRCAATGRLLRLEQPDPEPAAGLVPDFRYTRRTCPFAPGDLILGFTDGVIEAPDRSGEFYGDERLAAFVQANPALTSEALCAKLVEELSAYSGRAVFDDDVCLVAIESTGTTCVVQPVSYDI